MNAKTRAIPVLSMLAILMLGAGTGCSGNKKMVLELQGAVMYEKPLLETVSHVLSDQRLDGGFAVLTVTLLGDPGLEATFDITPGIADRQPMTETQAGRYTGEFAFPLEMVGGPYTVLGRLRHDEAGESILRDPDPVIIPLVVPPRS
jgi:hypothetical protein